MRYLIFAILSLVILYGCQGTSSVLEPTPKEYNVILNYNIYQGRVDPEITTIREGVSVTLNVIPKFGYSISSVLLNGVSQSTSGKYPIVKASSDVVMKIDFVLGDKYSFATKAPWYLKSVQNQYEKDGPWDTLQIDPRSVTDHIVLGLDGFIRWYDVNEKMFGGPFPWSFLDNNGIKINSSVYSIITLNGDQLIWDDYNSGITRVRYTYYHK
jgi:hypothetical protein